MRWAAVLPRGRLGYGSGQRHRADEVRAGVTVQRRHVIYVPGYDPRGIAHYYRSFRQELGRFRDLHGLKAVVSRPEGGAGEISARWLVTTAGPDWQVKTTYELLRWDDVVRADAGRPIWRKIALGWLMLVRFMLNGTLLRLGRAHWRFAGFFVYPYLTLLALVLASGLCGSLVAALAGWLGVPGVMAGLLGVGVGVAALVALLRVTEAYTYLLYLFDDGISTDAFARGMRPDWSARLALFAGQVIAACRSGADEVVIVGHSSGSFMAVDVMAQALARDPALGRHGPAVSLVTLGANLPLLGFNPGAGWFVERLRLVVSEASLAWLDVQSRKDVMSFFRFDQAKGHGIAVAAPNLTTVSISFRDMLRPENYNRFRWRFFRVHFQYLMANERKAAWDFYMLICGPSSLAQEIARLTRRG